MLSFCFCTCFYILVQVIAGKVIVMLVWALLEKTNLWLIILKNKVYILPRWVLCMNKYMYFKLFSLILLCFQKLVTAEKFLSCYHNIKTVTASAQKLQKPVMKKSENMAYSDLCFPKSAIFGSMRKGGKCDITTNLTISKT